MGQKRPFVGAAGRLLRVVLRKAGLDPDEEVYYTNAVACHPPGNKTPGIAQVRGCRPRLEQELVLVAPHKLLTVGGTALTAVLRADKAVSITRWHGRGLWTEWGGRLVYTLGTYHPAAVLRDGDYFRDFSEDVLKWAAQDAPMPDLDVSYIVPATLGTAVRALHALKDRQDLTLDLETSGRNPIVDHIVSFGIGNEEAGVMINPFLLRVPLMQEALRRFLTETYAGEFALWNAKFDIQFVDMLLRQFIRPHAVDGMVQHYLLDERPMSGKYKTHGLKAQARTRYDAEDYDFDWTQALTAARMDALYAYQSKDLGYTSKLKRDQARDMDAESPKLRWMLENILMPATWALAEIELHGVKIDVPYLEQLRDHTEGLYADKLTALQAHARAFGIEELNINSHQQVAALVYKHWKLPKPKLAGKKAMEMPSDTVAKEALLGLLQQTTDPDIQQGLKDIIELRLLSKVIETYMTGILEKLDPDRRIRSDFRLLGTSTGRLSSADPNLQNIPLLMGPEIRNAFIPSPGCVWVAADYSQLELRVAAVIADDEAMKDVFRGGRDIHSEVASMIFKKPADQITKQERVMAKHIDFGIIYGRSAASLVDGAELEYKDPDAEWWSVDDAELFLYRFLNGFPKLKLWIETTKKFAITNQYVESPLGRRRRWPFIPPGMANSVGREAANFPIQGTASDICLDAMVKLHDQLPDGAWVLFSVHDAINFEVRREILEPTLELIYKTMTSSTLLKTDVPFDVEIEVGERWGSGVKWKPGHALDLAQHPAPPGERVLDAVGAATV